MILPVRFNLGQNLQIVCLQKEKLLLAGFDPMRFPICAEGMLELLTLMEGVGVRARPLVSVRKILIDVCLVGMLPVLLRALLLVGTTGRGAT